MEKEYYDCPDCHGEGCKNCNWTGEIVLYYNKDGREKVSTVMAVR